MSATFEVSAPLVVQLDAYAVHFDACAWHTCLTCKQLVPRNAMNRRTFSHGYHAIGRPLCTCGLEMLRARIREAAAK